MLEYIVDGQIVEVDLKDKELFLEKYPNATEQKSVEPDFQTPTTPGAVVEETAAPDMDYNSGNFSLDSIIQENERKRTERELALEKEIEQRKLITDARAETTFGKMINSVENAILRIRGFDDRLTLATRAVATKIFGDEAIDKFVENPDVNDFWKIGLSDQDVENAVNEINRLEALQGKTGEITTGFQKGDAGEIVAGVFNAITSFGSSAVIGATTLGGGILTDFFADSYKRMNEERAEELGTNAIELMNSDDAEFYKPLALGTAAGALERIGIKGVGKAIGTIKSGAGKKIANRFLAGSKEAVTEYTQGVLEAVESPLVKRNYENVGQAAWDYMASKEGFESFLQGFAGGAGVTTGGTLSKKEAIAAGVTTAAAVVPESTGLLFGTMTPFAMRNAASEIRSPQNVKNIDKLANDIADLHEAKINVKDKDIKASIDATIADKQQEIANIISIDNEKINNIPESDLKEINNIKGLAQEFNANMANLNKKLRVDKTISLKEFEIAKASLLEKYKANRKKLDEKLSDISIKNQNISDENASLIKTIKTSKNDAAIEKAKNDLVENNRGFIEKLIKSTFNPNLDTELTEQDYRAAINLEFAKIINTYKLKEKVPFGAYLQQTLPKRLPAIFKTEIESTPGGEIIGKTDITQEKNIIDENDITFERTESKAKEQLRDVAGITKEAVQADAKQILKGKLPGILEKTGRDKNQILTEINKASKLKIADAVLEEMGGNFNDKQEQKSQFITFMDTNFDAVINAIPDASKNKLPLFEPQQIRRETTLEGDAAGKGVFKYKDVSRDEFIKYYTEIDVTKNPASEMNKLRAKKKGLADIIAQEIGKDAIAEVLQDPEVQKDFLERQKFLGKEIPQDAIPRLLQRIDRTIEKLQQEGDKFKGITAIGVSPKLITDSLVGGLKIIKKGLEAGLSFQKALAKGIDYIKRKLKSEAAGDVIGAEIQTIEDLKKLTDKQLQKVMEDVQEAIDTEVELGKQNKAYFKDLKSLNIKETLDLSRLKFNINESKLDKIKSNRLIKGTPKEKQDFINRGKEVVSAMPKQGKELFIDGKNTTLLQGLVGFHYRYVGSGQAPILYDNISTTQPAWISDKTKKLFKNLPKKIVTANDLKSVQIAINEAKTKEEKIQIAKDNLDKIKQHQKDVDAVFYAVQSLLSDYVYSAKNEQDLINKIDYVTKIKSTNSNNVNGDRALVKVNGFYIGPIGKKVKLEHVKTSAEQSIQGLQQILSGNIDLNITADFEGVYGFEFDSKGKSTFGFSKIDKAGKTNVSQYYRFKNSKDAANYILAEYNFEGSIANKNVLKIFNQIKKDKARSENIKNIYNKKDLNTEFNEFLEKSTGIGAKKVFSKAKAEARAKTIRKGFGDYFVPPGAEDFAGLMHKTLAKGKEGEKQLKFYQDNLYTPYNVANENITRERAAMFEDFRALKKKLSNVPKKLKQFTKGGDFTNDQAVRAFIWARQGNKVPGLSKTDARELINEVKSDKELLQFAEELLNITKGDGYKKPENNWMAGNIATDLMALMNSSKRSKHLEVWQNNVDQIFSEQNLNKLEAAYGKEWVTNLTKTLERMKIGSNRKWGGDKVLQSYLDWVNGSVGAIMFLNTRSAVLQTISNINYLNFSDNNPLKAAKAFANQKQYWSDFKTIFNSDYLQERRGGNKINVNESELALAAEKGGIQGTISLLLNKGFIFTKIADSFAIASGGASMYRNRIETYIKQGLPEAEATEKAFVDFKAITEETQQSSRPDRISEQQASNAGRLFLAFANTPMQYNRIIKKNAQDLVAGRGNKMEKVTKIIYYSTIQNLIFNAMQKALFALAFSEDDEDEKEIEKYSQIANGMADSLLRGMGMTGNAVVAVKNIATDIANRMDKPRPNFQDAAWKALTISPPIYSKVSKLRGAGYSLGYTTPENIFEPKLDNPALSAGANIISATTNVPLDRALRKAQNIEAAMSDEAEWWQSTALLMGWGSWELGMQKPKKQSKKKTEVPKPLFDKSQNIFNKRKITIFK